MTSNSPLYSVYKKTPPANINQEIQKFKQLKSQGILNVISTDQSYNVSVTPSSADVKNIEFQPRSFKKEDNIQTPSKSLDKASQGTNSSNNLKSTQATSSSTSSSTPWVREAIVNYLSSFQKVQKNQSSMESSALSRESSERMIKGVKVKTPLASSMISVTTESTAETNTLSQLKAKISIPFSEGQPIKVKNVAGGSSLNINQKTTSIKNSRPNSSRKIEESPIKLKQSPSINKSVQSTAEKSIKSPKSDRETKAEKSLEDEAMKLSKEAEELRTLGGTMSDSYGDLNEKFKKFMGEKEDTKSTIASLKDQVATLKSMLTKYQVENMRLKEASTKSSQVTQDSTPSSRKSGNVKETLEEIKEENKSIKKALEVLKEENEMLKKSMEDIKKYKEDAEYYKNLAEMKFKECSTLAEEIICLRTDLDRCNSNLIRAQKAQYLHATRVEEDLNDSRCRESSLKKERKCSVKKGVSWKEELIEKSPRAKATKHTIFK